MSSVDSYWILFFYSTCLPFIWWWKIQTYWINISMDTCHGTRLLPEFQWGDSKTGERNVTWMKEYSGEGNISYTGFVVFVFMFLFCKTVSYNTFGRFEYVTDFVKVAITL